MIEFSQWGESLIFIGIFSLIIIIPCVVVALLGRKMIDKLGQFPSNTPAIQMGVLMWLLLTEALTFVALIAFYKFFS